MSEETEESAGAEGGVGWGGGGCTKAAEGGERRRLTDQGHSALEWMRQRLDSRTHGHAHRLQSHADRQTGSTESAQASQQMKSCPSGWLTELPGAAAPPEGPVCIRGSQQTPLLQTQGLSEVSASAAPQLLLEQQRPPAHNPSTHRCLQFHRSHHPPASEASQRYKSQHDVATTA